MLFNKEDKSREMESSKRGSSALTSFFCMLPLWLSLLNMVVVFCDAQQRLPLPTGSRRVSRPHDSNNKDNNKEKNNLVTFEEFFKRQKRMAVKTTFSSSQGDSQEEINIENVNAIQKDSGSWHTIRDNMVTLDEMMFKNKVTKRQEKESNEKEDNAENVPRHLQTQWQKSNTAPSAPAATTTAAASAGATSGTTGTSTTPSKSTISTPPTTVATGTSLYSPGTSLTSAFSNIIGGEYVPNPQQKYPFFTSVVPDSDYLCGAALVAPDIVITSAHCQVAFVKGAVPGAYEFLTISENTYPVQVINRYIHPYFANYHDYDVMLIHISPPVYGLTPVKVNLDPLFPPPDLPLSIMGFGRTTDDKGSLSFNLLDAEIYEVPYASCRQSYYASIIPDAHLCAWKDDKNDFKAPCNGDSGGPIVDAASNTLIGMLSYSSKKCSDAPSVYTRTSGFADWIQSGICSISENPPADLECNACSVPRFRYQACLARELVTAKNIESCMACVNASLPVSSSSSCTDLEDHVCEAPYRCPCDSGSSIDGCAIHLQHYLECQTGCSVCTRNTPAPLPGPRTANPALDYVDDDTPGGDDGMDRGAQCESQSGSCQQDSDCCETLVCASQFCQDPGLIELSVTDTPAVSPTSRQPTRRPIVLPPTAAYSTNADESFPVPTRRPRPFPTVDQQSSQQTVKTLCSKPLETCTSDGDCCRGLSCYDFTCQILGRQRQRRTRHYRML